MADQGGRVGRGGSRCGAPRPIPLVVLLLGVVLPLAATAELSVEVIAATGEPAPASPPGSLQTAIGAAVQSRSGALVFSGERSVGGTPVDALWGSGPGGAPSVLFEAGDPAPGTPTGVVFFSFTPLLLDGAGRLVFLATLAGGGVTADDDEGVFGPDGSGGVALLLREGDPAPAPYSGTLEGPFFGRALSDAGHVVIESRRDPGPGSDPAWLLLGGTPGSPLAPLIGTGDAIPGLGGAELESAGPSPSGTIDGSGRFLTAGRLRIGPGGVTDADDELVLEILPGGAVGVVAREGDPAPAPAGALFDAVGTPVAGNANGSTAYAGRLVPGVGGVTAADASVSVVQEAGGATEVIQSGFAAPDLPGALPVERLAVHDVSPSGLLLFKGFLSTDPPTVSVTNDEILFVRDAEDVLRLVARQGAGEIPAGVAQGLGHVWSNGLGDVAYVVHEADGTAPEKVVFHPHDGAADAVVAVGDLIEVAPGELREITGFESFAFGRPLLGETRELVFEVRFLDPPFSTGHALLRAALPPPTPTAVPGPDAFPPLLVALIALLLAVPHLLRAPPRLAPVRRRG